MRRQSKRQLRMRFVEGDILPIRITSADLIARYVRVQGIDCKLESAPDRDDAKCRPMRQVEVKAVPLAGGDGWQRAGFKEVAGDSVDGFLERLEKARTKGQVRLAVRDFAEGNGQSPLAAFVRKHPVGSVVEAEVLWVRRDKIGLRLAPGVVTRVSVQDYTMRWPHMRRCELARWGVPSRLDVVIRRADPGRGVLAVSFHGYAADRGYCNAAAGYRTRWDPHDSLFRWLPWERPDSDRRTW